MGLTFGVLVVGLLALPAFVQFGLDRRDRRARAARWRDVPCSESTEAFRGYKVAQLVVDEHRGAAWLSGVTGRPYGVDVVAQCGRRGCEPPGLDCDCGFYAFRDREQAVALVDELAGLHPRRTYVLLTVDLDGDVLEYELGFRAARQRVHRIEVPGECAECLTAGVRRKGSILVADPAQRTEQRIVRWTDVGTRMPPGSAALRAVCPDHEPVSRAHRVDLRAVRGQAGTEVGMLADTADP